jgi:hypothetical protein
MRIDVRRPPGVGRSPVYHWNRGWAALRATMQTRLIRVARLRNQHAPVPHRADTKVARMLPCGDASGAALPLASAAACWTAITKVPSPILGYAPLPRRAKVPRGLTRPVWEER